jgi:hypothetical protein
MSFLRAHLGPQARWDPYVIPRSKLKAWWHADDHGMANMTDAGSGVISAWKDRIGGLSLAASTTARPTWAADSFDGGLAGVTFDGTANVMSVASIPFSGAVDCEIWALVSVSAGAAVAHLVSFGGTGSATSRQMRRDSSNRLSVSDGSTILVGTTNNSFVGPHIAQVYFASTTMGWRRDGGKSANSASFANTAIGTTRTAFGASNATTPASFGGMVLRQLFIFQGSLTTAERNILEYYLAIDADDPTLLDSAHPYYFGTGTGDAPSFTALPSYFTPADRVTAAAAGYQVIMMASPPSSDAADETTYAYWPLTDSSSQTINLIEASTWSGKRWGFLWANRRNTAASHNYKSNPIFPAITLSSKQCRAEYSTIAKANAATKVRAMHWLGYTSSEYNAVADAAGFTHATDILTRATLAASPATYFTSNSAYGPNTYLVMTDKIWLNDNKLSDASAYEGIILDYEVQDSRTTTETQDFLLDLASTVQAKGKKLYLYTNRLDGGSAPYNALTSANCPAIYAALDGFGLLMVKGNDMATTYAAQKAILGV